MLSCSTKDSLRRDASKGAVDAVRGQNTPRETVYTFFGLAQGPSRAPEAGELSS